MYVCMLYIFYTIICNSGYVLILPNLMQLQVHLKNDKFSTNGVQISFRSKIFRYIYDLKFPPRSRRETALLWIITQQVVVISYRRFGTTCRFHLQSSRIQERSLPLKIGPIRRPETSARNCHYLLPNIREEGCSHFIICSKILKIFFFGGGAFIQSILKYK